MNKMVISLAAALAFCSFDPWGSAPVNGAEANKNCICSFLTLPSSIQQCDDSEEIEYSFRLYEIIKELFS